MLLFQQRGYLTLKAVLSNLMQVWATSSYKKQVLLLIKVELAKQMNIMWPLQQQQLILPLKQPLMLRTVILSMVRLKLFNHLRLI